MSSQVSNLLYYLLKLESLIVQRLKDLGLNTTHQSVHLSRICKPSHGSGFSGSTTGKGGKLSHLIATLLHIMLCSLEDFPPPPCHSHLGSREMNKTPMSNYSQSQVSNIRKYLARLEPLIVHLGLNTSIGKTNCKSLQTKPTDYYCILTISSTGYIIMRQL